MTERKIQSSDEETVEVLNGLQTEEGKSFRTILSDFVSWVEEMIILGSLLAMTVYGFLQWVRLID